MSTVDDNNVKTHTVSTLDNDMKKAKTLYLEQNSRRAISLIDSYVISSKCFHKRMTKRFLLGWSNNMPTDVVTSVLKGKKGLVTNMLFTIILY